MNLLLCGLESLMSWLSSPEIAAVLSGLFASSVRFHLAQVLTNFLVRPELSVILCYIADLNSFLNTEQNISHS